MRKDCKSIFIKAMSLAISLLFILSGCSIGINKPDGENVNPVPDETNKSSAPSVIVIPSTEKKTEEEEKEEETEDTGEEENEEEITEPEITEPTTPESVQSGLIPESERCDDSYFNDAVFIGDSISLMLSYYARDERKDNPDFLGSAQFLTSGSFSYRNAILPVSEESIHPSYQGEKMTVEKAISLMGAKKVYIMLGMNDIAGKNYENTLINVDTLISRILEYTPDAVFYLQSVTPRMSDSQTEKLNNDIIREWNQKLMAHCEENGYYFVNTYEAVVDSEGNLTPAYCSDPVSAGNGCMGIHMTYAGCEQWVNYLYTHTALKNG